MNRFFQGKFRVQHLAIPAVLLAAITSATAAVTGEFLYLLNSGAGAGGIWGVDAAGINFFAIQPGDTAGTPAGSAVNPPPYPRPQILEFGQAKNNGRIVFGSVMNPGDSERLFVVNGDGTGYRQVTFHDPAATQNWHSFPSISADGSKIAYVNAENIAPPGTVNSAGQSCAGTQYPALWVANADGTNPHLVRGAEWANVSYCNTGSPESGAVWSPDGARIAVKDGFGCATFGHEVVVMNADGSNPVIVECIRSANSQSRYLDWSPDGTKLAVVSGTGAPYSLNIYNTSTWALISSFTTFAGVTMDNYVVRFSPDSSKIALYDNNDQMIHIGDLSGASVATVSLAGHSAQPGQLWWNSSSPGILSSMTLGVPSVYVNACPNYTVWLNPSTFNTVGGLVNHGFNGILGVINTGDGDSWGVDGFGNAYYAATRGSATGTLQLANFGVGSNTVPLTVDATCACQSSPTSGLTVRRSGLRYVAAAQQQFEQTITVTNNTASGVAGPINVVIENLTSTVTLTNAGGTSGCTSSGSPYMTMVQPGGSLGAGQSATVQLYFRDPSLGGFTYSTTVTNGAGAP